MDVKDKSVDVFCKNNNVTKSYPIGTDLLEIYKDMGLQLKYGVIAARANNKTKDLKFCIYKPKTIEFIGIDIPSGMRVYVRSLCFVLYKAVRDLFPGAILRIEHPISKGYYCKVIKKDESPLTEDDIVRIKENMNLTILQDIPFEMEMRKKDEAVQIFKETGATDVANLLESMNGMYFRVYKLGDLYDYYGGALAPSTGYLRIFDLRSFHDGMLLQVPNRKTPIKVEDYVAQDKIFQTFTTQAEWNKITHLNNVGEINLAIQRTHKSLTIANLASIMIMVIEALQDKTIARIADQIVERKDTKIVLIAGPSSSGKTTFSKKLSIQLGVNARRPHALSLDDYFIPRSQTPKDEDGEYDFESLYALDLELFNKQMNQLIAGEEVELPYYNFETGEREYRGKKIKLAPEDILVIEGIHGLNPELTAMIPDSQKFKVYISVLTTLSLDNHNWIPTADNRLLRRIVRDYKYRGYSAEETIDRWKKVREGEDKWIFPFQENADVIFNSALLFEIPVIKRYVEPLLMEVPQDHKAYCEAHRLLKFLRYFTPIQDNDIPNTSVLREFVGGSSFIY